MTCHCGAALTCTICESCSRHCRLRDPVRCAEDVLAFSLATYGEDDPHTVTAREQLEEARRLAKVS